MKDNKQEPVCHYGVNYEIVGVEGLRNIVP